MNIQSLIRTKPRYCRHCDVVVLSSGIKKKPSEIAFLKDEDAAHEDDEVTFCSMNCYMQFAMLHKTATDDAAAPSIMEHKSTEVGSGAVRGFFCLHLWNAPSLGLPCKTQASLWQTATFAMML